MTTKAKSPVTAPKKAKRRTPMSRDWEPAFLEALALLGHVGASAEAAGIDRRTASRRKGSDRAFAEAWAAAMEIAADTLEDEARRRAVEGWMEPVYQGGKLIGSVHKYDSTLLIFLLKGARPQKYRERFEITHISEDQLDAEIRRLKDELARNDPVKS